MTRGQTPIIKRLALVLVDISGYTRFVKMHTMSLLHAESIITDLLEAVINNAEFPLTLSKQRIEERGVAFELEEGARSRVAAEDILRQVDSRSPICGRMSCRDSAVIS